MSGYSDAKFGVIERKWFGLTKKVGGDCADGYTFGTTDATTIDHLSRWYPKGPIRLLKVGAMVLATIAGGGTAFDDIPVRLLVSGSTETTADFDIDDDATIYTISSLTTFTNPVVDAGSYIGIRTGTPVSGDGTAANTATVTGTVAFFVDYTREFHQTKWNK